MTRYELNEKLQEMANASNLYPTNKVMKLLRSVAAMEREACANVCESLAGKQWVTREASLECSDAIRARGNA